MANWKDLAMASPEKVWGNATSPVKVDRTPEKRRNKTLEGIDATIAQLAAGGDDPQRGWFKTAGDVRRVQLKCGNKVVAIGGRDFQVVPSERAADFYKALRADVAAGEFDSAIADAFGGSSTGSKTRRSGGGGGWSEERARNYAENRAGRAARRAGEALDAKWSDAKKEGYKREAEKEGK